MSVISIILISIVSQAATYNYTYTDQSDDRFNCSGQYDAKKATKAQLDGAVEVLTKQWEDDYDDVQNMICDYVKRPDGREKLAKERKNYVDGFNEMLARIKKLKVPDGLLVARDNKRKWIEFQKALGIALLDFAQSGLKDTKSLKKPLAGTIQDGICTSYIDLMDKFSARGEEPKFNKAFNFVIESHHKKLAPDTATETLRSYLNAADDKRCALAQNLWAVCVADQYGPKVDFGGSATSEEMMGKVLQDLKCEDAGG